MVIPASAELAAQQSIAAQAAIAMDNAHLFEQAQWVQEELRRSNQELRRANQDLEVFSYSASHDLQEPLRTIAISAQLIERNWGSRLQGEDAEFLGNILAASNRMGALIEDLLAYTRATKYEEGLAPDVDSAHVLTNVLKSLSGSIDEAGAMVTSADLPMVAIHESRLAQLFQNLISNAIKYRGKEVPRVHVTAGQQDGWCVFSVVDNGIGVEKQYAEQIFGLFKRLHGRAGKFLQQFHRIWNRHRPARAALPAHTFAEAGSRLVRDHFGKFHGRWRPPARSARFDPRAIPGGAAWRGDVFRIGGSTKSRALKKAQTTGQAHEDAVAFRPSLLG
jgi:two-component sensor histidine kinase